MLGNLLATFSLLVGAGVLAIGIWVVVRGRWQPQPIRFGSLCLLLAVWLVCSGMMLSVYGPTGAEAWSRASYLGLALVPAALYQLIARVLRLHDEQRVAIAVLWALGLVLGALAQATDLLVSGVEQQPWGWNTRLAPAAAVLVALYLGVLLSAIAQLGRQWGSLAEHSGSLAKAAGLGGNLIFDRTLAGDWSIARDRTLAATLAIGGLGMIDFVPAFGWKLPPLGALPVAAAILLAAGSFRRHPQGWSRSAFAAERILESLQGAVLVSDLDERVRVANAAACKLLGYSRAELLGLRLGELIETPRAVGTASDTLMRGGQIREREMIWRRGDHSRVGVEVSVTVTRDEAGAPAGMVFVAGGIDDDDRAARIEYQAFHDPLTGLPNRAAFSDRLQARLAAATVRGTRLAVLFFDLDGFKVINDSLGHSAGDRVLQMLARRLRGAVREGDLVCRFGGDEFTVLVDTRRPDDAESVAQKLLAAVAEPFVVEGQRLYVTASIGVAQHPEHGEDAEILLRNADTAMYLAKELGRNNYQVCGHGLSERARQRLWLEAKLRNALASNGFDLHYQPVIELATGQVVGAEALLRWSCDGQLLTPESFLPLAEETLLIRPLGDWVLRTACAQGAAWQERFGSFRIGVNLSAHQLVSPSFVEQVENLLDLSGLPPQRLELEITESVAMKDPERTRELLSALKDLGVRLALDDFGTGYSSLAYLQQFPLDAVKIDRSFIAGMGKARGGLAIIRATLAMAVALGLRVTAEGVETQLQLDLLRDLGCHCAQGFGIGVPVAAPELERLVRRGRRRADTGELPLLQLDPEAAAASQPTS